MKRVTLDLDDDLYKKVKIHCAVNGVTFADLVRGLLSETVEKVEKKKKEK
jgi:hypothetical protein